MNDDDFWYKHLLSTDEEFYSKCLIKAIVIMLVFCTGLFIIY